MKNCTTWLGLSWTIVLCSHLLSILTIVVVFVSIASTKGAIQRLGQAVKSSPPSLPLLAPLTATRACDREICHEEIGVSKWNTRLGPDAASLRWRYSNVLAKSTVAPTCTLRFLQYVHCTAVRYTRPPECVTSVKKMLTSHGPCSVCVHSDCLVLCSELSVTSYVISKMSCASRSLMVWPG